MNINYNIYENQVDKIPVTETAIVAFIDILGFKELIKEYDNGINQNLLKDIISSMNTAVDFLKMNINNEPDFLNWNVLRFQLNLIFITSKRIFFILCFIYQLIKIC